MGWPGVSRSDAVETTRQPASHRLEFLTDSL